MAIKPYTYSTKEKFKSFALLLTVVAIVLYDYLTGG